ncbi:hypothetical protein BC831DRAFT_475943 [Entophlyctis helioformis]|nr:hypothetical protein BC831DRAFT_475943 [Entophlyctis helioformis]
MARESVERHEGALGSLGRAVLWPLDWLWSAIVSWWFMAWWSHRALGVGLRLAATSPSPHSVGSSGADEGESLPKPADGPSGYEVWMVDGHLTETLVIPAAASSTSPASRSPSRPSASDAPRNVLVFFPGNPGTIMYYEDYLTDLHRRVGSSSSLEIVGCSYPGHATLLSYTGPPLSLDEQVAHKVAFFNAVQARYPPGTRFFLGGHSLGTYMTLQVLKAASPASRSSIVKVLALFPTLHSMAVTPQGRIVSIITLPGIRHLIMAGVALLRLLLPPVLLDSIVQTATAQSGKPLLVTSRLISSFERGQNALYLGACEMNQIVHMDHDTMRQVADKYMFYYGAIDPWCPLDHYEEMRILYPETFTHLCKHRLPHAFVLQDSHLVAAETSQWLAKYL